MNLVPLLLMIGAGLLTVLYQACMESYHRLAGPDRAGALIGFPLLLLLRWSCLTGLLVQCISRGALPWPESRPGQYVLAIGVHAAFGVVSLLSGMTKAVPNGLSEPVANALGWVPFLLPGFEVAAALTVLFPDALEASSLMPVRLAALGLAAAVALPAALALGIMTVREHREREAKQAAYEREEAEKERAAADGKQKTFDALTPESPLADWFPVIGWDYPETIRTAARAAILKRPRLGAELAERILSPDPESARVAMYFVGEMDPPPADVADAVRARAREVVRIAESIDASNPDSRNQLYERAHTIATGITAAAHGLRRAGIDLRPELKAVSAAAGPREQAPPRSIADSCDQIVRYFDQLDRERSAAAR